MISFPTTISGLTGSEQQLYRRLLRRLYRKRNRNRLRSTYYNGRNQLHDIGYSLPPVAKDISIVVGWPEKAIEGLANRVRLDGFIADDGSTPIDAISELTDANDVIQLTQSVHTDAFVHSCSFVAVLQGDPANGEPEAIIQEFTADTATGEWDKRRKRLATALLFDVDDEYEQVNGIYLMDYEHTVTIEPDEHGWHVADRWDEVSGRIPCELFAYKPDSRRPFGRSRINRTVMSLTDSAVRTFLRSEIQAELYSVPGRYFLGVNEDMFTDEDGNLVPKWKIMLDQVLAIPRDQLTGQIPQVGQFQQASFEPHLAQLRQTATMFASATSLPPDAMGVLTDNPSSAEAIDKASKELCLLAENCHNWFGRPWQRVIEHAQRISGDGQTQTLLPQWRNPSTPSKAAAADLAVKLVGANILPADSEVTWDMLDLTDQQRRILRGEARRKRAQTAIDQLRATTMQQMQEDTAGGTQRPASAEPTGGTRTTA
ncbi:phage portal protein [Bifidobacterium callimiconis]|uniref:Portal protein n=1 Tax=Bifidobacterium callimiconis TaxID=2306973 RepID=A0A430FIN3_9BIFI|nr:phage portal protein [Bifidobacterium callimiconis]RSX52660.1 portal protein [Bifidobacterium callimiconis]